MLEGNFVVDSLRKKRARIGQPLRFSMDGLLFYLIMTYVNAKYLQNSWNAFPGAIWAQLEWNRVDTMDAVIRDGQKVPYPWNRIPVTLKMESEHLFFVW